jgi:hypothetical protein
MRLTAVEWLVDELNKKIDFIPMEKWDMIRNIVQQAKEMERGQVQLYVIFCLRCMKENLPIIKFEDFIKLEGGKK